MTTVIVILGLFVTWVGGSFLTALVRPTDREREGRRARREELRAARKRCRQRIDELGR